MSISDTVGQVAATNPVVAVAVQKQSTASALLAGTQSIDPATSNLLSAIYSQSQQVNSLLSSLQPNLGQNVDTQA